MFQRAEAQAGAAERPGDQGSGFSSSRREAELGARERKENPLT